MEESRFVEEQLAFWRALEESLRAGTSLLDSLDAIIQEQVEGEWKEILIGIRMGLKEGKGLAELMGTHAGVFSDYARYLASRAEGEEALCEAAAKIARILGLERLKDEHFRKIFGQVSAGEVMEELKKLTEIPKIVAESLRDAGIDIRLWSEKLKKAAVEEREEPGIPESAVRLIEEILQDAKRSRASDIHLEPRKADLCVRFRIDGVMREKRVLDKTLETSLTDQLRQLAGLERGSSLPQEGSFEWKREGKTLTFRVSIAPCKAGERAVLHLVEARKVLPEAGDLGLDEPSLKNLLRWCSRNEGIIVFSGPTGSGKQTTVLGILNQIRSEEVNVVTVEFRVVHQLPGVNQLEVKPALGLDFPAALRAQLNQDPDIVYVSEISDGETARLVLQAATSGHLLLAGISAKSVTRAIRRLVDYGVNEGQLRSAFIGITSQRLLRKICPDCRETYVPGEDLLAWAGLGGGEEHTFFRGKGCPACAGTGYLGREGLFELLEPSPALWKALLARAEEGELERILRDEGKASLLEKGLAKALAGATTLEEVYRVVED
jgi:general secretion pathway protein E